jgi:N-acetylglucosaminyl-diphospho-decaprenol L-rhamnosyltransferase
VWYSAVEIQPHCLFLMLSIIIVSWNTRDLLRRCLQSIDANKGCMAIEIIVVDNASHDGTPAMLRTEFPTVQLMETGANLGFSAGNNVGLAAAQGDWVLLLNPDTEIVGDALQRLVATLEDNPFAGVVAPRVQYGDGTEQVTRHRFPLLWTLGTASTPIAPLFAPLLNRFYYQKDSRLGIHDRLGVHNVPVVESPSRLGTQNVPATALQHTFPTDWLTGAALLVKREVYERVRGFDEQFFMYFEETDWQRRIKAAGWTILYDPSALIVHHEAQSSGQVGGKRDEIFNRSRLRYAAKWHGVGAARLLRLWLTVLYALEWVKETLKWLMGHKRPLRRQRMTHYQTLIRQLIIRSCAK